MAGDELIARLVDEVRRIDEEETAPPWGDLWDRDAAESQNISMFTYPNPLAGTGRAPYVFFPDANFYSRLLGYSLKEVFTDAKSWVSFTLEQMIWNHENLHHDSGISRTILINQLGFFAPSLFGMMPIYKDDAVPWIKGPVINERADLAKLEEPNFHKSGLSPLVHQMYEEARELLPDDFQVEFTTWLTGPFGLIYHLRGALNLARDLKRDPHFVHEMMTFANHCMKNWWKERARFHQREGLEPLILGNDEIGVPMISPSMYEEFILPYEIDLSEYFDGVDYWHSCSNTTLFLPLLARIPNLRMMDVGPWTALKPAVSLFGQRPGSSIMKRIHPVSEILMADEKQMRNRLMEIKATCYDVPYMLFFDGINPLGDIDECVEKIRQLDRICHEIFHCDPTRPRVEPEQTPLRS